MLVMHLVHSVRTVTTHRERVMPKVIAVGSRSSTAWMAHVVELLMARLGWLAGRVPAGVTPTLGTSRWWR
jgi:hypothetical protein